MPRASERASVEGSGSELLVGAMRQDKSRLAQFVLEALDLRVVNARTECGWTPLIHASLLPDPGQRCRYVRLLLEKGGDVNGADRDGRTALSHSCQAGHGEVVKLLVKANADPQIPDAWGNDALIYSALAGQGALVDFLVRSFRRLGLDVARANHRGISAIEIARDLGHTACLRALTKGTRRRSSLEPGNGGPLEDITLKGYEQNQGLEKSKGGAKLVSTSHQMDSQPKRLASEPLKEIPKLNLGLVAPQRAQCVCQGLMEEDEGGSSMVPERREILPCIPGGDQDPRNLPSRGGSSGRKDLILCQPSPLDLQSRQPSRVPVCRRS
ncbi:ankyrin repeat domain-containing protein 63 [Callorhinchus milii]|uniref:ankyrin repeat domain-containing protein 63 n=1 Tax=Callorhinchus milii TaxID=7868 RepID=UPI001C3FF53B|nr:ankyrin repeat domain-containing protein 63 [Callorhinchus milii]